LRDAEGLGGVDVDAVNFFGAFFREVGDEGIEFGGLQEVERIFDLRLLICDWGPRRYRMGNFGGWTPHGRPSPCTGGNGRKHHIRGCLRFGHAFTLSPCRRPWVRIPLLIRAMASACVDAGPSLAG
jgi:hypothetical protein